MQMTLDAAEVRQFTDQLMADLDRCDNGEGMVCSTIEQQLEYAARKCRDFSERLRQWAWDVFRDRIAFVEAVEIQFRADGQRLLDRCKDKLTHGRQSEQGGCYVLAALAALEPAVTELDRLLSPWVRPVRSITPGPRAKPRTVDAETLARLAALPPLPRDWKPAGIVSADTDG